jgi:peptidoglycan/LPS O-acetylase OafA/YrhL
MAEVRTLGLCPRIKVIGRDFLSDWRSLRQHLASTRTYPRRVQPLWFATSPSICHRPLGHHKSDNHVFVPIYVFMNRRGYFPALDGYRGVAISLVLFEHLISGRFGFGRLGVQMFFVLSGFLITGIIFDYKQGLSKATAAKVFYWHRFIRLSPVFYVALAVATAAGIAGSGLNVTLSALYLGNFTSFFKQEWAAGGHLWSLAVEEQFYLIFFPLAIAIRSEKLPAFLVLTWLASLMFNAAMYAMDFKLFAILLPGAAHGLAAGGLLALSAKDAGPFPKLIRLKHPSIVFLGVLVVTLVISAFPNASPPLKDMVLPPFIDVLSVALIVLCTRDHLSRAAAILCSPPLIAIGKISYGLYVYHGFVIGGIERYLPNIPHRDGSLIALVASVSIAIMSYHLMEKPILKFKNLFSSPSPTTA